MLPDATLQRICRYPVKGFTGQDLNVATLARGRGLPNDRHLAIVSGNRPEIPKVGGWVPSRTFIQNTVFDDLLTFDCRFEDDQVELVREDGERARVTMSNADSLRAADPVLANWFQGGPHGPVRLVEQSPENGFWDYTDSVLSIINLQSVRSLEQSAGQPIDPARFRGNLYVDGVPPWEEFSWTGKTIRVGETVLEIIRPILRCAATSVDPVSGARDFNVPGLMQQQHGHAFCGVYARVASGGSIRPGDPLHVTEGQTREIGEQPDNAPEQNWWPTFVSGRMQEIDGKPRPFLQITPAADIRAGERLKLRIHELPVAARSWAPFDACVTKTDDNTGWTLVSGADDAVMAVEDRIVSGKSLLMTGPF